jgi:Ca-activated chloride channel homolog
LHVDPLVPPALIAAAVVVAFGFVAVRVVRGAPGWAVVRSIAMTVLAATIAIDPAMGGESSEARRTAANVLFVVDSTSSMAALDYDGDSPRLEGVRADIVELAAAFPGARFALVRFDSHARLEVPWTTDAGALESAVSVLRPERALYSRGSRLDLPLLVIHDLLRAVPAMDASADGAYGVVFYFSDGEQRSGPTEELPPLGQQAGPILTDEGTTDSIEAWSELAPDVDGGAVFGYGTTDGAPMLEFVGADQSFLASAAPYVYDYEADAIAISRLDEANLADIARDLGVPFVHRTSPGGLTALGSAIAADAPTVGDGSRGTLRRMYWVPALGLFALALWQATATANEAIATRRLLGRHRPVRDRVVEPPVRHSASPTVRPGSGTESAA